MKRYLQYIKENNTKNFRVGDIVVCISEDKLDKLLVLGNSYKVEEIRMAFSDWQIKLFGVDFYWYTDGFRFATPEEVKKFEIETTANKFNL